MPFYQYFCEANGETVEVFHAIRMRLKTWDQVCRVSNRDLGSTPGSAPVVRLISRSYPVIWKFKKIDKDEPGKKLLA